MKIMLLFSLLLTVALRAERDAPTTAEKIQKHQSGSELAAQKQDALAADVQQLRIEQTQPKVATLLSQVEVLMDEASGNLIEFKTGGETLSAQTEVIEKIYEAAKSKKGNGNSKSADGMLQMMERMMGKNADADEKKNGKKPGEQPGNGMTGDSSTANEMSKGRVSSDDGEERRIPKAAGASIAEFPEEFQNALDGYNRATKSFSLNR